MKLGTLHDGTSDGRLVVIDTDVLHATDVGHVAPSLLRALEDWDRVAADLALVARGLDSGGQPMERFHERGAQSPLPHGPRLLLARDPDGGDEAPRLRPVAADGFLDPRGPLPAATEIAVSLAVAAGPVAAGASAEAAGDTIRLVLLMLSLKGPDIEDGMEPVAFAPAAVTPDALDAAGGWSLAPRLSINGQVFAPTRPTGDRASFAALIARAAEGGAVPSGSLIAGPALIRRPVEAGDEIRLEAREPGGRSIFGAIEQRIGGVIPHTALGGSPAGIGIAAQMMWAPF